MTNTDEYFYKRADEHIDLANKQITKDVDPQKVAFSFMFSVARFDAWVSAFGWNSGAEMKARKEETIENLLKQYKIMLEKNYDDYVINYDSYMNSDNNSDKK